MSGAMYAIAAFLTEKEIEYATNFEVTDIWAFYLDRDICESKAQIIKERYFLKVTIEERYKASINAISSETSNKIYELQRTVNSLNCLVEDSLTKINMLTGQIKKLLKQNKNQNLFVTKDMINK